MLSQENRLLIITEESQGISELYSGLVQKGFACEIASAKDDGIKKIVEQAPDLVLVAMNGHWANSRMQELSQKIKQERPLPIVALVNKEALDSLDVNSKGIDDFVVKPGDLNELVLRIKRLLRKSGDTGTGELIKCGDLLIDLAKCEVSVSGRIVELTFKEYEVLRFLASNPGRVFTRNTLLNKVWGYDYYGGDRTVDVHVRRLRSKIEDSNHTFIETVRNIGYRFKCHS
jgi:two-component system alkaline phosphatase synthesis response regulator PhoP